MSRPFAHWPEAETKRGGPRAAPNPCHASNALAAGARRLGGPGRGFGHRPGFLLFFNAGDPVVVGVDALEQRYAGSLELFLGDEAVLVRVEAGGHRRDIGVAEWLGRGLLRGTPFSLAQRAVLVRVDLGEHLCALRVEFRQIARLVGLEPSEDFRASDFAVLVAVDPREFRID